MIFSSNVLKDGLSKKNTLEYELFCITWKDGIFFPEKHDIFSLDGKWKMIFLEKLMEIWYFPYMCINVRNMILPFWKKKKKNQRWFSPEKIRLKVIDILDRILEKVPTIFCTFMETIIHRRFHILLFSKKKQES